MVDIGEKAETDRLAVAGGSIIMQPATLEALRQGRTPKGDPLQVAQVAGIMDAKRTPELIPLCHPLPLSQVDVRFELDERLPGVHVRATARVHGRTGVEMEALTAASVALLTIYDMLKGFDRELQLSGIRLLHKEGGKSGTWTART